MAEVQKAFCTKKICAMEIRWWSITIFTSPWLSTTVSMFRTESKNDRLQPHLKWFFIVFTSTFWSCRPRSKHPKGCDAIVFCYVLEVDISRTSKGTPTEECSWPASESRGPRIGFRAKIFRKALNLQLWRLRTISIGLETHSEESTLASTNFTSWCPLQRTSTSLPTWRFWDRGKPRHTGSGMRKKWEISQNKKLWG